MKKTVAVKMQKGLRYALRVFSVILGIVPAISLIVFRELPVALASGIPLFLILPAMLYCETWQIRFGTETVEKRVLLWKKTVHLCTASGNGERILYFREWMVYPDVFHRRKVLEVPAERREWRTGRKTAPKALLVSNSKLTRRIHPCGFPQGWFCTCDDVEKIFTLAEQTIYHVILSKRSAPKDLAAYGRILCLRHKDSSLRSE